MSKMWFAPKRFGYGASLPTTWQGWAVYIGYIAAVLLVVAFPTDLQLHIAGQVAAVVVLTIALLIVTRAKTDGGWRWRWGRD